MQHIQGTYTPPRRRLFGGCFCAMTLRLSADLSDMPASVTNYGSCARAGNSITLLSHTELSARGFQKCARQRFSPTPPAIPASSPHPHLTPPPAHLLSVAALPSISSFNVNRLSRFAVSLRVFPTNGDTLK